MDYGPHGIDWQVKREGQKGTHASESAFVGDRDPVAESQSALARSSPLRRQSKRLSAGGGREARDDG